MTNTKYPVPDGVDMTPEEWTTRVEEHMDMFGDTVQQSYFYILMEMGLVTSDIIEEDLNNPEGSQ